MLKVKNIHILNTGANVHNIYQKIFAHYTVSRFILLSEKEQPDDVRESIDQVKIGCGTVGIPVDEIWYEKNNLPSLIEAIIRIRKDNPEDKAKLYFNVTAGQKHIAIMAFIGSLWTNGVAYYLPKEFSEPLELPGPKMPLAQLQSNLLFQRILFELHTSDGINQSTLREKIGKHPKKNKDLAGQTLSESIKTLVEAGMVSQEERGRDKIVSLTLGGRVAYSVLTNLPSADK